MTEKNSYDAIVIGSGMGGLTAAAVLARVKRYRVLVLEQHFKLGGFTHTFQRPGCHTLFRPGTNCSANGATICSHNFFTFTSTTVSRT